MEATDLCEKKRDFNQNLIEPFNSFEQFCNMICQLEKDSDIEITACQRMDTNGKHVANLDPASREYPGQVSDRSVFIEIRRYARIETDLF